MGLIRKLFQYLKYKSVQYFCHPPVTTDTITISTYTANLCLCIEFALVLHGMFPWWLLYSICMHYYYYALCLSICYALLLLCLLIYYIIVNNSDTFIWHFYGLTAYSEYGLVFIIITSTNSELNNNKHCWLIIKATKDSKGCSSHVIVGLYKL